MDGNLLPTSTNLLAHAPNLLPSATEADSRLEPMGESKLIFNLWTILELTALVSGENIVKLKIIMCFSITQKWLDEFL